MASRDALVMPPMTTATLSFWASVVAYCVYFALSDWAS